MRRTLALLLLCAACAPSVPPAQRPLPSAAPGAGEPLSTDARRWVDETIASLTLREKVGQLVMPWVSGKFTAVDSEEFDELAAWVEAEKVGGLVLSMGTPHTYAAKLNELQRRADVPLLIASDMENGPGMRLGGIFSLPHLLPMGGGTVFPPVMAIGATGSDSLAYALGRVLGTEARAIGVHMVFGPVLDVNSNPLNPIINTRSFGEDPALVARMGAAYIRGARDAGLMTTAKHFPGHGDTSVDSHIDLPTIERDRAGLDAIDLPPFRAGVEAGVDGVMTAHIAVVGVEGPDAPPATLSPYFMTGVLRDELGFTGLLFTDAMTMGGVAKRYGGTEPLVLALEAGADVLLMPRDVPEAIETVVQAVESGRIMEARIERSVRRILEAKARAGLAGGRLVDLGAVDEVVAVRGHTAVAEEIAERSITLVRDRDGLVPLAGDSLRVLSITYADDRAPVAGRAFDAELRHRGQVVLSARVDDRSTQAELDSLRLQADSVDLIVASAYVSPREYEGSVATEGGFAQLVEALSAAGLPIVAVSFGSPYLLDFFPSVPAYLLAWGGAEVSQQAAARALTGEAPITGRLPVSLPPYHSLGTGIQRPARVAGGQ